MVDPFSVAGLSVASMQFFVQLKTYLQDRRRRKQEEQQQRPHTMHYHYVSIAYNPIITYCICNHVYPPCHANIQYIHPAAPQPYYHSPASYSFSQPPLEASNCTQNDASAPPHDWLGLLGGRIELLNHQQAPHNPRHARETLGMRTGACASNDYTSSFNHWKSLKEESTRERHSSIAVVDWSRGNIDMFMEIGGAYFRNYRVNGCDVAMFAHLFKRREVFTGEIKEKKLQKCSKELKMVEMRWSGVQSTNSWMSLGVYDDSEDMTEVIREQTSFIQTVRGAVFGLVCALYEDPSHLNVDMESPPEQQLDIVRVSTHRQPSDIMRRDAWMFSVFSFGDHGWAAQDVLIG